MSKQRHRETSTAREKKIRILVAKPGLDGHDRGALILCRAFRDAGMEVIYTGFLATPEQVAQMAIDEDVDVVAMSLLNGAHMTAFPKVAKLIREKGGDDILLVGGGIIPDEDKPLLEKQGITGNFGPGTPLKTIIGHVESAVSEIGPGFQAAAQNQGEESHQSRMSYRSSWRSVCTCEPIPKRCRAGRAGPLPRLLRTRSPPRRNRSRGVAPQSPFRAQIRGQRELQGDFSRVATSQNRRVIQ